ncbi:MAG: carboxylating nicotinate-nucleotide diphosphorylase [Promethearchaeota archaeon]|nr:MAG: carboxylating nicotinate-nucleotide diphosphorylase [Candidatus Lokiarchaeota archaeon]
MKFNPIIIERKIKQFIEEDCNFVDISSSTSIEDHSESSARIIAKSSGYISGLEEIGILFNLLDVSIEYLKKDGERVVESDIIATLKGPTQSILLGERTALNLLTHMSAITTTTRSFVDLIKTSGKKVKIACTRKTLPGLRIFEKKAVYLGGGETHRFSLDDMILLKDTHLRYYNGDVSALLKKVKKKASFTKKIEIEIEKVPDVIKAAKNQADIIMLDNMSPNEVQDAINLLKKNNLRDAVTIEVSGNISIDNILNYVTLEPDIISSSEITQFPSEKLDLSLKFD